MKLKPGVKIEHKRKKYKGEIPDEVFKEFAGKEFEAKKAKFELQEKKEVKEVKKEFSKSK